MVSLAALANRKDDKGRDFTPQRTSTEEALRAISPLRDQKIALEVLAVGGDANSTWSCPLCAKRFTCESQEKGLCSKGFVLDESDPLETQSRLHDQLARNAKMVVVS